MSCDGEDKFAIELFYRETCKSTQLTLYKCISLLVRWFYVNTPKWTFGHGGSSDDVICRSLNLNNYTSEECKAYVDSLVYQRTDIFLTTCVCVIVFMAPYIFKIYNKPIKDNTHKRIHAFACTVVSLVSMEGVKDSSIVDTIKHELNKMDKVVSWKIGKKCSSYHTVDFISFMNSDAVDAIMQRCLETNREKDEDGDEDEDDDEDDA